MQQTAAPDKQPPSMRALLELPNDAFLEVAYRLFLRRAPDQGGTDYYLSLLRCGALTRADVAWRINCSQEGRRHQVRLKGAGLHYLWPRIKSIPPVSFVCELLRRV